MIVRLAFGFHNPNHAAALACALLPLCWGWRRAAWAGRVLVLFGGRNADGRPEVSGKLGWTAWADLNGVFLVAPTLRDDAYWEPEAWSGAISTCQSSTCLSSRPCSLTIAAILGSIHASAFPRVENTLTVTSLPKHGRLSLILMT